MAALESGVREGPGESPVLADPHIDHFGYCG